jgi:hypothetical protein
LYSITIPNSVQYIIGSTFEGCTNLTSVTLPTTGFTYIGDYSFYSCTSLQSITIPTPVTYIGTSAFQICGNLTSITIPNKVTNIGANAFAGCHKLKQVTISDSSKITTVSTNSFVNVNSDPSSNINFDNTIGFGNLSSTWKTISGYYRTAGYFNANNPLCFNKGTLILCINKNLEEEYIPIENLRNGDLVKSYKHGYRKIILIKTGRFINKPEQICNSMYKMEKTNENGLIEDLIVTGGHAILVDDLKEYKEENDKVFGGKTQIIDDKYLLLACISKDFIVINNSNVYTYYHFILENNDDGEERFGVWANGILTETPSQNYLTQNFLSN